jgi:hypothetical protein
LVEGARANPLARAPDYPPWVEINTEREINNMSNPLEDMTDDEFASFLSVDGIFDYWERQIGIPVICDTIPQEIISNKVAHKVLRVA